MELLIPEGRVDVWWLESEGTQADVWRERWVSLLTADERAREERYKVEEPKRLHRLARGLLRTTLSRYAPVDPADWRFACGPHGRPEVDTPAEWRRLRFNLSHTSGLVVCGVTPDADLGVDVERVDRPLRHDLLADRFFSPEEAAALRALPEGERRERFFTYWTLKESYIKARGMGLALPLGQFSFRLGPPIGISFGPEIQDEPQAWAFSLHRPTARHLLAVGVRRPAGEVVVRPG